MNHEFFASDVGDERDESPPADPEPEGDLDSRFTDLYECLRGIALRSLANERINHTLQATALVHEAWLRLSAAGDEPWLEKRAFVGICSRVLRQVLVDHARRRAASKRGGNWGRISLHDVAVGEEEDPRDVLALDDALTRFAVHHARAARVVELRFFGGLDLEETAKCLSVSPRSVTGDWQFARAWLARSLEEEEA